MWDLVGNPEDRFSHNGAHLDVEHSWVWEIKCVQPILVDLIKTLRLVFIAARMKKTKIIILGARIVTCFPIVN